MNVAVTDRNEKNYPDCQYDSYGLHACSYMHAFLAAFQLKSCWVSGEVIKHAAIPTSLHGQPHPLNYFCVYNGWRIRPAVHWCRDGSM